MFGLGAQELLVILAIVIVLFGAKRLPEIGSALGKSVREFKRAKGRETDGTSSLASREEQKSSFAALGSEEKKDSQDMPRIPGTEEVQEIKKTAGRIKAAGRFFLKK